MSIIFLPESSSTRKRQTKKIHAKRGHLPACILAATSFDTESQIAQGRTKPLIVLWFFFSFSIFSLFFLLFLSLLISLSRIYCSQNLTQSDNLKKNSLLCFSVQSGREEPCGNIRASFWNYRSLRQLHVHIASDPAPGNEAGRQWGHGHSGHVREPSPKPHGAGKGSDRPDRVLRLGSDPHCLREKDRYVTAQILVIIMTY